MTVIAFLLGLAARGSQMQFDDPLSWLILVLGVALIIVEISLWVKVE